MRRARCSPVAATALPIRLDRMVLPVAGTAVGGCSSRRGWRVAVQARDAGMPLVAERQRPGACTVPARQREAQRPVRLAGQLGRRMALAAAATVLRGVVAAHAILARAHDEPAITRATVVARAAADRAVPVMGKAGKLQGRGHRSGESRGSDHARQHHAPGGGTPRQPGLNPHECAARAQVHDTPGARPPAFIAIAAPISSWSHRGRSNPDAGRPTAERLVPSTGWPCSSPPPRETCLTGHAPLGTFCDQK